MRSIPGFAPPRQLESVWQDAAYAIRALRRQPGFTAVALLVLGTAIGLNASLFTVFAGMAFRPWAGMTDPSRVVTLTQANPIGRGGVVGAWLRLHRAVW